MKHYSLLSSVIIIYIIFITSNNCTAQKVDFKYKSLPKAFVTTTNVSLFQKKFVDLTLYLPSNYVKDGSVDYTSFLQKGIDANANVKMPNFSILVNDKGLLLKSNSIILFQSSSTLLKSSSTQASYSVLNLNRVSNVKILNPVIVGDRQIHKGNKGEWGMGISINSSSNVSIYNSNITNCWGDGIYIGNINKIPSNNIMIDGGKIDNNRRNGISIISGKKITVRNIVLSNTNGTLPSAGIDLEPNSNQDVLENVVVENVISYNNADAGFLIYLASMLGSIENNVTISLIGITDYYSPNALSIPGLRNDYKNNIKKISGNIKIQDFTSNGSKEVFARSSGNYVYTPKITVGNMKVISDSKRDLGKEDNVSNWMKSRKMRN